MALSVPSGLITVSSGATPGGRTVFVNSTPVTIFGASGDAITDYSGAMNVNISGGSIAVSPFGFQSGTSVVISGGPAGLSGLNVTTSVNPFGYQSGTLVGVSGGQLALSGVNVVISGGAFSSNISGMVGVSGNVAVLSGQLAVLSGVLTNILSGTVGLYEYPTYALISYWSGAVGKGLIGVYNSGGATSGYELELVRMELGIVASGLYNRFDLILGSGNISGTAGTIVTHRFADAASAGVGYVDGATQVSGNVISTLHSIVAESNASGIMHNYVREWILDKGPRAQSGQELWVKMTSGIGIGVARLEWVERYP
jgi:hypothetical protein